MKGFIAEDSSELLQSQASSDNHQQNIVASGLLYGSLLEQNNFEVYFRCLVSITRDHFEMMTNLLIQVSLDNSDDI